MKELTYSNLKQLNPDSYILIDTRDSGSILYGMIPGAIHIAEQELYDDLARYAGVSGQSNWQRHLRNRAGNAAACPEVIWHIYGIPYHLMMRTARYGQKQRTVSGKNTALGF